MTKGAVAILAQVVALSAQDCLRDPFRTDLALFSMAPMKAMKAMKKVGAKTMTKGGLAEALAEQTELKKSECMKVLMSLGDVGAQQVKKAGKFVLPGLCMVKTRVKPATKAGKREVFGKVAMVKAKPARTIVKAYPVAALKKSV